MPGDFSHRFNPRPACGAKGQPLCFRRVHRIVSIRAPRAGRKTRCGVSGSIRRTVSIRAPRAGRKPLAKTLERREANVSIRAPRAGRKPTQPILPRVGLRFNPRPACGAKASVVDECSRLSTFQSAPRVRGERPLSSSRSTDTSRFQSAPRVRGESDVRKQQSKDQLFQSAPRVRGERDHRAGGIHRGHTFQSAPRVRGERTRPCGVRAASFRFNPRPACGAKDEKRRRNPP